jgi:hypothetical protein
MNFVLIGHWVRTGDLDLDFAMVVVAMMVVVGGKDDEERRDARARIPKTFEAETEIPSVAHGRFARAMLDH